MLGARRGVFLGSTLNAAWLQSAEGNMFMQYEI